MNKTASPIRTVPAPELERALSKNARKRFIHRRRVPRYIDCLLGTLSANGDEQTVRRHEVIVQQRIASQVNGFGDCHPDGGHIQIHVTEEAANLLRPGLRQKKVMEARYDSAKHETVTVEVFRHEAVEIACNNDGRALMDLARRVI